MTREEFFNKFEFLAELPDAIPRMRMLILRLAVEGELVAQNSGDEPAAILLARIERDAAQAGLVKRLQNADGIASNQPPPFKLPVGWQWSQLGRLTAAEEGAMCDGPFGSKLKTEHYVATRGYAVVRLGNIGVGNFIWGKEGYISREHYESLKSNHLTAGDLLVAGLADPLVRCCEVPSELGPAVNKADCFRVRIHPLIDRRFVRYYLNSPVARVLAAQENHGMTRERINLGGAKALAVPVPPLTEQKRIVAKVDELMALCDRLEAQQKERDTRHAALARASLTRFAHAPTPANLTFLFHKSYTIPPADLRKSILTLAVQGGLVPFDSSEKQIVGDHIEFLNGFAFKSEWFKSTGTRLCRNANVDHGFLDWHEPAFVDETIANEFQRFALAEGDIVLSLDRPLISTGIKVARVRASDLPCLLLQRVAKVIRKHDELELAYFFLWLNSSQFVDSIDPGRSNGVPHISTRQVERLPFVLPPLAEQRRIVAKVDQLMALVDELETQLAASRTTAAKLLDAVVSELTA